MMRTTRVLSAAILLFGLGFAAAGCGSAPEIAAANQASYTPGNAGQGKQVFGEVCATCHGQDAKGTKQGPSLAPSKRVAGLQAEYAVFNFLAREHKPPLAAMRTLNADKLRDVAAYLVTIQPK